MNGGRRLQMGVAGGAGAPGAFCGPGGGMSRKATTPGASRRGPGVALGLFLPWSRGGGLDLLDRPCQAHHLNCCSGSTSSCESAAQFSLEYTGGVGGCTGLHTHPRASAHAHTRTHAHTQEHTCVQAPQRFLEGPVFCFCSAFLTVLFPSP